MSDAEAPCNVLSLKEGGNKPNPQLEAFRNLQSNLQTVLDAQRVVATITRAKYLALIEQGFDEKQALELCK